jgi:lipopolysaccharide/colanic/teichoic acid biosynthesis glycosyltransferase
LSIVGPRPVVKDELEKYGYDKELFLSVKPGLTGYWQVNGRSAVTYEKRMELELYYIKHKSFWLDLKIVLKTFFVVFQKLGAK